MDDSNNENDEAGMDLANESRSSNTECEPNDIPAAPQIELSAAIELASVFAQLQKTHNLSEVGLYVLLTLYITG